MDQFDIFDTTEPQKPHIPTSEDSLDWHQQRGPNAPRRSNKEVANDVITTFYELGGVEWLLKQARINPRAFMDLLKRVLPKEINLDTDTNFALTLVNSYIHQNRDPLTANDAQYIEDKSQQQVIEIKEYTVN